MSKVLVIIMNGVEELEAMAPVDLLRRAGVEVTVAATGNCLEVVGRNGIRISADILHQETRGQAYDLIIVPGGPGHADLLGNDTLLKQLAEQHRNQGLIASICAGPVVLQQAGVLEGKRYTSFPATVDQLPDRDPESAVVVDGNIITSQGAGTALLFALALVEALCGPEKRAEIAASICFGG